MKANSNKRYFSLLAFTILIIVTLACGNSKPTSTPKVSTATLETQATQIPGATAKPAVSANTSVPSDTSVPPATKTPVPPPTNTPVTELYLGDAVSAYGYALTGISVQDPATPGMFYTATSGKKLIAVEIIISNLSGDMLSVNPLYATLVDKDGFTYQAELGGVDDQLSTLDLNPGEKVKGLISYQVPDTAVAASIKYSIEVFGSKILKASLTPAPEGHVALPEPPSTSGNSLPKLGDVVENFGYSLTAVSVEDPATPGMFYTAKKGYKLVAVEIVLGNVSGSEALSVNPLYTYLIDSNGFVYEAELGGKDDQIATSDLATGEKSKGWVAFTIPENATPVSVKYATKIFSGNYLYTGLTK
jgi:hypothetical protein